MVVNEILYNCPKRFGTLQKYSQTDKLVCADMVPGLGDATMDAVPWEALAKHYGTGKKKIYIGFEDNGSPRKDNSPQWRELNFGSRNPNIIMGPDDLLVEYEGRPLDSFTIQAQRSSIAPAGSEDIIENAIQGFLNKEGYTLIEVRGGTQDQAGTLNVLPGGSATYKSTYEDNPLMDAMCSESADEAGTEVKNLDLVGIFNQRGVHTNRQHVYLAEPVETLDNIINMHRKGLELYTDVKSDTGDESLARKALMGSKYPKDAWEARKIIKIPLEEEVFLSILSDGEYEHAKDELPAKLIGSLWASLYIAGAAEFDFDFREKALGFAGKNIDISKRVWGI